MGQAFQDIQYVVYILRDINPHLDLAMPYQYSGQSMQCHKNSNLTKNSIIIRQFFFNLSQFSLSVSSSYIMITLMPSAPMVLLTSAKLGFVMLVPTYRSL